MQMSVKECAEHIKALNPDLNPSNVKVAYPRKFNYYRIWIEVDEDGKVVSAPGRG